MDSRPNSYALAAPCLALSATMFFLGTGLNPLWMCTWLAAVPVLWLAPRVSQRYALFVSAAAYALGGLNEWSYSRQVLPTWIVVSLLFLGACLFGLAVVLFRRCIVRHRIWQAILIFPAFWVIVDYLISRISIHGTFGNIAYSQMNFLPILQVASVTGIWGISFCIFLLAATTAAIFSTTPRSRKFSAAMPAMLFLLLVFIFGFGRLAAAPKNAPTAKVALMASSAKGNFFAASPEQLHAVLERYADAMKPLLGRGIQLIVLPEHTGPVTDLSQGDADALLGAMARNAGAYVAIGVERIGADLSRNQERIYSPNGSLLATYNKHHMLPPFESQFVPGTNRTVLDAPSGKWGVEICKDMDFPPLSRGYANDGIGMLIVSASDFVADGWLHGRMAVLRGIEDGFSIARSANLGILTATDDRGRVLREQETITGPPFVTAIADLPVRRDVTIYSRFGDWFAWLSIALFLIALLSPERLRLSDSDRRIGTSDPLDHPAEAELSRNRSR